MLADDQYVNQELMKLNFDDIGLAEKLVLFSNGLEVVNYFTKILENIDVRREEKTVQPVSLLLLDINMPILDGFETLKQVKQLITVFNDKNETSMSSPCTRVLRPLICYYTQYKSNVLS